MPVPHEVWAGSPSEYLGMWMAMMVPMMLPSLIPLLWRYRRSLHGGADGLRLHGLTALAGAGYFVIWAWRHGLGLGLACGLCCGNLMVALLAIGMMDPLAMAAVTVAISAERLAPARWRVAPVAGVVSIGLGVLTIVRV